MHFKKLLKKTALASLLVASSSGFANPHIDSTLGYELGFTLKSDSPATGGGICYFDSLPRVDIGDVEWVGEYHYRYSSMSIECEGPLTEFFVSFDQMPGHNGPAVYSDEYIDVYIGIDPDYTSAGLNYGYSADSPVGATDCTDDYGITDTVSIDGIDVWPIGGTHQPGTDNGNTCITRNVVSGFDYFNFDVEFFVLLKKEVPQGVHLPSMISVPAQLMMQHGDGGGDPGPSRRQ